MQKKKQKNTKLAVKKEKVKRMPAQVLKYCLRDWRLYVLLLPAVIYVFIFNYIPMYGVQIAFRDFSPKAGIWGSEWVGLKYFKQYLNYPNFKLQMRNTLEIGLYNLATFPCPVIFALMLNELRSKKLKKTMQMISYMPYFLSTVVVCSMITLFMNGKTGIINNIIEMLGGTRVDFLTVPEYFADIYVWSGIWQGLGWSSIIYIAALSNVSSDLVEAARIDGASRLKIIWHVYIPSILPTLVIMLILDCGQVLNVGFEKVLLLQNSLNTSRSQVLATYVYEIGIRGGQYSYSAAIGLFNNIISIIILVIVNTIAKKVSETSIW